MRWRLFDAGLVRRMEAAVRRRAKQSGIRGFQKKWWSGAVRPGRSSYWLIWLVFIAIRVMAERMEQPAGNVVAAGCASLAFAGIALQRARKLRVALTRSFERVHSYFVPISEQEFVDRTLLETAQGSWWILAAGIFVFGIMQPGDPVAVWSLAPLAALVELAVILGLVYALEPHLEVIPKWLPFAFFGMAVVWFYTPQPFLRSQQLWVNVLPTGWVNAAVMTTWSAGRKAAVLVAGLVGCTWAAWFLARRRSAVLIAEFARSLAAEQQVRAMDEQATEEKPSEQWQALEEPEGEENGIEEEPEAVQRLPIQSTWQKHRIEGIGTEWGVAVRQGGWLRRPDWRQMPWMERAVGWWLNEKEKDLVWFLVGGKIPEWSNAWKNSVIALAVGMLLMEVLPTEWKWASAIPLLVSLGMGLPLAGGKWAATSQGWISGKLSPIYAIYPVRYGAASRVMAKVNLLRTAAWLPLLAVLSVVEAKLLNAGIGEKLWLASRCLLVWLAWIPIAIAAAFSKVTNDTSELWLGQMLVMPVVIVTAIGVLGLWVSVLMAESLLALALGASAIAASVGIWVAYGWWYERKVDLLRDRQ